QSILLISSQVLPSRDIYIFTESARLCVIIFAYGIVKCLSGKTFRAILRIFYQYRPRFHTETRRAKALTEIWQARRSKY
ncbi:MAG: hypothetical protein ACKOQ2_36490, partial [Dolichospermum sp.]